MSKIKVGDNVLVKETGEEGVVKGRDVTVNEDGTFNIEFIVKKGNGFSNWGSYKRKELKRNNQRPPQPTKKVPINTTRTVDGYKVVVVGNITEEDVSYYEPLGLCDFCYYVLSVGYAICNPEDEFNLKTGIGIANYRSKKHPFARYVAGRRRDFTKETIEAIINVKADYIASHIEQFTNIAISRNEDEDYF